MKVGFNARLLHESALRGWNRYTLNLLVGLAQQRVALVLYSDRPLHPANLARLPAGSFETRESGAMAYLRWEQRWLPRACGADRVDLLHCPLNFGLPWSSPCPRVLTLHDAIDQVFLIPRLSWLARLGSRYLQGRFHCWVARTRAEHVIAVSEHARGDLVRRLEIPACKVTVVSEAADERFHAPISDEDRARVRKSHGLARPYFFYVGGWEERKNIPFLLSGFARAGLGDIELVLAGGRQDEHPRIVAAAEALGIAPRLRLLNWVEDADLPAIYAEALAFVYPSQYEGFGLQLCEAMAVGCPALAARATSLPEVLGDGGELFGLEDAEELAALLRRVAGEATFRAELAVRARRRSDHFSWARTATETIAVYRRLLEKGPG